MPTFSNPVIFSTEYGLTKARIGKLGVLNPYLNVDTKLFIDPLLLADSQHEEMKAASRAFAQHFDTIMRLLINSDCATDVAWKTANRIFQGGEIRGTCLGYGTQSTSGTGISPRAISSLLLTAKQIIDLGCQDPDLFYVAFLLEPGVGPDAISDLTTNIILHNLSQFNQRVCKRLGVETSEFTFSKHPGKKYRFPVNTSGKKDSPLILVPLDILRDLPIAVDWDDVCKAAAETEDLRNRVNQHIGDIWHNTRQKFAEKIKKNLAAYQCIRDSIKKVPKTPYDSKGDPSGILEWGFVLDVIANDYPLSLPKLTDNQIPSYYLTGVVKQIINQFTFLVEKHGLWQTLWYKNTPKKEKAAQLLFFAVAHSYCKANNIDITPEADTGNGPVDFKFSHSYKDRHLVEIKLSTGTVVHGYEKQLEFYKSAEETESATYLVIDVGNMGKKDNQILDIKNKRVAEGEKASSIYFVDGKPKKSASKRE